MSIPDDEEVIGLKKLINNFLIEQKNKKNESNTKEKNNDANELVDLENDKFTPFNWISNASKRSSQRQIVTHAIKYHNPDARGSGVFLEKTSEDDLTFVCTNTLSCSSRIEDSVGNAAALDVQKFLMLSYDHESIINRILRKDQKIIEAFPGSLEEKIKWFEAFSEIIKPKEKFYSHTFAKQVYYPVVDEYHLISPLFPSTLIQYVFDEIQKSKFDKEARKAKRENNFSESQLRYFPDLAVQNFGGSKPQNISFLNTKRDGKIYLLPSSPPIWKSQIIRLPFSTKSIFKKYFFPFQIRKKVNELKSFLSKLPKNYTNSNIQANRERLFFDICEGLIQYVAEIRSQTSGWSSDSKCILKHSQKCLLDPGHAGLDKVEWLNDVSDEFASWLNKSLKSKDLPFGDNEHHEWKRKIKKELTLFMEEIS